MKKCLTATALPCSAPANSGIALYAVVLLPALSLMPKQTMACAKIEPAARG